MVIRRAAWADHFYPARAAELERELERHLGAPPAEARIPKPIACVAPHAAYIYSGAVAGALYARLDLPDRFVILCPNHTGRGTPLAVMSEGAWQTPLGEARIDATLAAALKKKCRLLSEDSQAHAKEHALEVQLPFLQKLRPQMQFVPIAVGTEAWEALENLGQAMAATIAEAGRAVLIIASSDMNHFESDERTRRKDRRAIDQVLARDARGLYDTVRHEHISMCGYCPTVAALVAANRLGARDAELVRYATSAETSGDYARVVGYAGMAVF